MSVSNRIPGAAGLRVWSTYHGPMRDLVALRAAGVFSIVQRGHGPPTTPFTEPQNGQTCLPSRFFRTWSDVSPIRIGSVALLIYWIYESDRFLAKAQWPRAKRPFYPQGARRARHRRHRATWSSPVECSVRPRLRPKTM